MNPKRLGAARWIAFGSVLLFGAAGLVGCGGSYAKVTGKVQYKDKLLPSGTISFIKEGMDTGSAEINADGTYTVQAAPIGECKVTVVTKAGAAGKQGVLDMDDPSKGGIMKQGGGDAGKNKPGAGHDKFGSEKENMMGKLKKQTGNVTPFDTRDAIQIPAKYANPTSSPLTFQVKKGTTNHFDIDLTD